VVHGIDEEPVHSEGALRFCTEDVCRGSCSLFYLA
jgi:hypothetical protein